MGLQLANGLVEDLPGKALGPLTGTYGPARRAWRNLA